MQFDLLSAPELLADTESVPDEFKRMYFLNRDGLYQLTADARATLKTIRDERGALIAHHEKALLELDAKAKERAADLEGVKIEKAVREAVGAEGADGPFVPAAAALFMADNTVVISATSGKAVVVHASGELPLRAVAKEFMAAEGQAFVAAKPAKAEDIFTNQIRSLIR